MIIPDGFGQFNIRFSGAGIPNGGEVTLGFENTIPQWTPLEACQALETVLEGADTLFAATMPNFAVVSIRCKLGPNDDGPFAELPVTIPGTNVTTESMPNVSYLVHKQTNLGGRHGRGRLYWPGVPLSETGQDGTIGIDARDGVTEGWEFIRTELAEADAFCVLLHATSSPAPTGITAFACDAKAATQRRRLRG